MAQSPHTTTTTTSIPPTIEQELVAEEVVARRAGDVLLRHTILKSDHFPGCQNTRLTPLLDGAPNFRGVPGLPVYGVAIPTASGLRNVLDTLGASKNKRKIIWINLREEPVLYINGRPFVVREADKPFANLEYTGIDRDRVENMENRLKADVLHEASQYNGAIMVAHEDDNFQVVEDWEAVTEVDVQTPADVYAELAKDGYDVEYLRVPITDEKAPKGDDFESLIGRCWVPPEGAALVFNCQMGRGRTTTGMTIGSLLHLKRVQTTLAPPPLSPAEGLPDWWWATPTASELGSGASLGGSSSMAAAAALVASNEEIELKGGMFSVIRSLLRVLEKGREAKAALDLVLDACSAMQNLREAISSYRNKLFAEPNDMRRQSLLQVCLEYLERYYVLVAFAAYLDDGAFSPGTTFHIPFANWCSRRPELSGILQRLLRANPLAALSLDKIPGASPLSPTSAVALASRSSSDLSSLELEQETILAQRDGSVLGPRTILKQDHFPGCQSSHLPDFIQGAPNFRGVPGDAVNVYGGAVATEDGIRRVLEYVNAAPVAGAEGGGADGDGGIDDASAHLSRAVWHMMREEPVLFIKGQPYVLREESRPFKNLMEYRGIDFKRLDSMEHRLKDDVIAEASRLCGRILVTLETSQSEFIRILRQEFIKISGPQDVKTPKEVFQMLAAEGYRVSFLRIPITDGTCPRATDFDAFYSAAAAASPSDALIYTCQLGGGRTTTGMAIGTLLRMHLNGAVVRAPSEVERRETLQRLDEDLGRVTLGPQGSSDDEEYEATGMASPSVPGNESNTGGEVETVYCVVPPPPQPLPSSSLHAASGSGAIVVGDRVGLPPRSPFSSTPTKLLGGRNTVLNSASKGRIVDNGSDELLSSNSSQQQFDPESYNLQQGEYIGVRRFTWTLERGAEAKAEVDTVVDACGTVINLRTAIMRYRTPKSQNTFYRPEIQARHSAFQRGSAYLERYCMLISFSVYLAQCRQRGRRLTFEEWLAARPDIISAREAIHQNPAGALAPVPMVLPLTPGVALAGSMPPPSSLADEKGDSEYVPMEEQRNVLLRRKGSTVGRRSILKSFTMNDRGKKKLLSLSRPDHEKSSSNTLDIQGVTDIRKAINLPVYTIGNATVDGLRKLLSTLGALPGGNTHVVITDLREELVLYVNGTAYLRRQLEMPAAALHHAGIQAAKLEDLERRLRSDMANEAASWGGRILLHREIDNTENDSDYNQNNNDTDHHHHHLADGDNTKEGDTDDQEDDASFLRRGTSRHRHDTFMGSKDGHDGSNDDITKTTDYQPTTQVAAFWENAGDIGDIDCGMCTPSEVFVGIAAEGYQITYKRVPMSRERTPQAVDLDQLHMQILPVVHGSKNVVHIFVSRTAVGSSARFAAAFACAVIRSLDMADGSSPRSSHSEGHLSRRGSESSFVPGSSPSRTRLVRGGISRSNSASRSDLDTLELVRRAELGEYRNVMNLCRVLPGGAEAKAAIDAAINACDCIGNLREDILRCKEASEEDEDNGADASAARRLGLHYLQRYFFLVAFRAFLDDSVAKGAAQMPFSEWVGQRKEISHLLLNLELE